MLTCTKMSVALCVLLGCLTGIEAFSQPAVPRGVRTALQAESTSPMTSRRGALLGIMATVGAVAVGNPEEASARYSSYASREQDWADRQAKGEVTFKTAKDLRAELQEMVPQNSSRSKIFCPNGPSSAVSPLMENKCGDREALPSVYGRTQDAVGNSIPGFATSRVDLAGAGGFPSY